MSLVIKIIQFPRKESVDRLSNIYPTNPFFTFAYAQARKLSGHKPVLFEYYQDKEFINGFIAFEQNGVINKSIEVPSFPPITSDYNFWNIFINELSRKRYSHVNLGSFSSPAKFTVPELNVIVGKRERCEYHLNLMDSGNRLNKSANHKRNIKKARNFGIKILKGVDSREACERHSELIDFSMNRRARGSKIKKTNHVSSTLNYIQTNSGKLFQASLNQRVLSSVLILEAERGIYYHSAGTSEEGMALGASHFLIDEIADEYRNQSKWLFNLGGTLQDQTGLQRFKKGFGATPIKLETFDMYVGGYLKKILTAAAYFLKGNGYSYIRRI